MGLQLDPQRTRFTAFVILMAALTVILFLIAPLVWSVSQMFIIAGLITLALDAPVHWQVVRGVPRWAAVMNTLLLLMILLIAVISFLAPPVTTQFRQFVADFPFFMERLMGLLHRLPQLERSLDFNQLLAQLFSGVGSWVSAARSIFATAIGAVSALLLIVVTVFYTLVNPRPLLYGVRGLFPSGWWDTIDHLAMQIAQRLRAWVVGTMLLSVLIGVLDYLALLIINRFFGQSLPFIFFFAFLGGLLEVVPIIGPIIAAVLPALVGFSIHPLLGVSVLVAFFLIQQLEANVLTPVIMNRAVKLHPVSLLFALVVLSGILGIFGAIIAVPVASVCKVLYDEWYYPLTHDGNHPQSPPAEAPSRAGVQQP